MTEDIAEKLAGDLAAKAQDCNMLRKIVGQDGGQELVVCELMQTIKGRPLAECTPNRGSTALAD